MFKQWRNSVWLHLPKVIVEEQQNSVTIAQTVFINPCSLNIVLKHQGLFTTRSFNSFKRMFLEFVCSQCLCYEISPLITRASFSLLLYTGEKSPEL